MTIVLLLYLGLVATALSPFDCVEVEGKQYMRDDIQTQCEYRCISGDRCFSGVTFVFLYGVLPLLWFGCVLQRAKKHKQLNEARVMQTYGALYLRYEPSCPRWELVIMLRKLAFVLTQRLLGRHPGAQLVALFVNGFY